MKVACAPSARAGSISPDNVMMTNSRPISAAADEPTIR
jgi:hypothetical protein